MNRMRIAAGVALAIAVVTAIPAVAASKTEADVLNGTYRVTISDADLISGGVMSGDIRENHGRFTWVLRDGRWRFHQSANNHLFHPNDAGTYTVRGDQVTFTWPDGPKPTTLRWKRTRGELRLTVVSGGDRIVRTLFTAHPWRRIS